MLNDGDHDCLYREAFTKNNFSRHLIPYCIRSIDPLEISDMRCHGTNYTFLALRQNNVTSTNLFDWQSSVDIVSEYVYYLQTGVGAEQIFCNCSHAFGTRCQYSFAFDSISFDNIVEQTFALNEIDYPIHMGTDSDMTCYLMFNCTTYIDLCLDWRQVCDGLRDCTNGRDEENCLEMELSECDVHTEYRCRNGMCIPKGFSFDLTMDCMDFYDEQEPRDQSRDCSKQSSADCEDHTCGLADFNCGDGSCFKDYKIDKFRPIHVCDNQRNLIYLKKIFKYENNTNLSDDCWRQMWCLLRLSCLFETNELMSECHEGVHGTATWCETYTESLLLCPEEFFFPSSHFILPFVKIMYKRQVYDIDDFTGPFAVCYNKSFCDRNLFTEIYGNETFVFNGYHCLELKLLESWIFRPVVIHIGWVTQFAVAIHNTFSHCKIPFSHSTALFQCPNHMFISHHRLSDQHDDCKPWFDDENNYEITCHLNLTNRFTCQSDQNNPKRCIPRRSLNDLEENCHVDNADELFPVKCTDEFSCQYLRELDLQSNIPIIFEELCNGFHIINRDLINAETDETDCDEWPCDAYGIYCDGVWNRPNGCDEVNCSNTIPSFIARHVANCSVNEHYCLQYNSSQVSCLPLFKANDGTIDCLFGSDERKSLQANSFEILVRNGYVTSRSVCLNQSLDEIISIEQICNRETDCLLDDDELLCPWHTYSSCYPDEFTCKNGTCIEEFERCDSNIDCLEAEDEWGCDFLNTIFYSSAHLFSFQSFTSSKSQAQDVFLTQSLLTNYNHENFWCHRGILVKDIDWNFRCLCPPSYYGVQCQYQSERLTISFDMEMLTTFNLKTIYQLVFYLLDGQEKYLTVETLIYVPMIHSSTKQLITLLYPRRNQSLSSFGNMSVRIDAYIVTLTTVDHSLSWFYPLQFSFLPVNRLAIRLFIEERHIKNSTQCARLNCQHGICQTFVNIDRYFCKCFSNWTGTTCNQSVVSLNCSMMSKFVLSHRHASCICPLERTGIECRVPNNICLRVRCLNGGICLSLDPRTAKHVCICADNFFGDECENENARLILQIPRSINFIPVLIIHFLHSPMSLPGVIVHRNIHFYKHVQPNSRLLIHDHNHRYLPMFLIAQIIHESTSYYGSYFLLALIGDNRTNLTTSIFDSHRCPHVSEHLNSTLMQFEWLKRAKFYHKYFKNVKCFYDETNICLINDRHLPECLIFNHGLSNCTDRNYCENGGRCLQRKRSGQLNFACVCPECIAGAFCQLKMTQFSLTLDSMLGETIVIDRSLPQQLPLIKILLSIIVFMFVIGTISNVMSFFTFTDKNIRQYGCGNYLFILSIVCQLTLIIFVTRFIYLLVTQMTIVANKRLLSVCCTLFDFVLSLLIYFCDWLTACIACERTISVVKGARFNREKSTYAVRFVVPLLIIVLVLTSLHQPFNRILISDPRDDDRLWCVIKFRFPWLQTYTIVLNLINSIVPFLVNFVSAIILLVSFARTKQRLNTKHSYAHALRKQIRQHKDLIISPLLMIVFKLPLIIFILVIKCIKSEWQLYLAVVTYFLSFVPITATFAIFIMPAPSYLKTFIEKRSQIWNRRTVWKSV